MEWIIEGPINTINLTSFLSSQRENKTFHFTRYIISNNHVINSFEWPWTDCLLIWTHQRSDYRLQLIPFLRANWIRILFNKIIRADKRLWIDIISIFTYSLWFQWRTTLYKRLILWIKYNEFLIIRALMR